LYENDGKGNYKLTQGILPEIKSSTGTVNGADFDQDGDMDLFVGGRIVPGSYPLAPTSFLLENIDGKFVDKTREIAPALLDIGMVTQGIWSDFDSDNDLDLILVGEWMPVTVMENKEGTFTNSTEKLKLSGSSGFWNSITATDLNNDGRMDYVLGNLGANNAYRISEEAPLTLKAKDFDENGSIDPILFKEYIDGFRPVASRDAFLSQLPNMRLKYPNYESYALAGKDNLFDTPNTWESELELSSRTAHHELLLNYGKDSLTLSPLPNEAQFAPVFGTLAIDTDRDGAEEVLLTGNLFSNNVIDGPFCSAVGALMNYQQEKMNVHRGNTGNGFLLKGDRKALALITMANGRLAVISTTNSGKASLLQLNSEVITERFQPGEYNAVIRLANGKSLIREAYYGSGYLSQHSPVIVLPESWEEVSFYSAGGRKRTVNRSE
jgi:hypothetical protein